MSVPRLALRKKSSQLANVWPWLTARAKKLVSVWTTAWMYRSAVGVFGWASHQSL